MSINVDGAILIEVIREGPQMDPGKIDVGNGGNVALDVHTGDIGNLSDTDRDEITAWFAEKAKNRGSSRHHTSKMSLNRALAHG